MLTTGIPQIVAGIAVFLVCGVLLFSGKVRKRYWCLSCLVTALLVGRGVWCANDFFDLGMGTPKVFSPENWEKTKPEQRHFMVDDLQAKIRCASFSVHRTIRILRRVCLMSLRSRLTK